MTTFPSAGGIHSLYEHFGDETQFVILSLVLKSDLLEVISLQGCSIVRGWHQVFCHIREVCLSDVAPPPPSQQSLRPCQCVQQPHGSSLPLTWRPSSNSTPRSPFVAKRVTALFSAVDDGHINVRQIDHVPVVIFEQFGVRQEVSVLHYTENGTWQPILIICPWLSVKTTGI